MKCSKCNKEVDTLLIEIALETMVYAINGEEKELIPNLSVTSKENLCKDCFNIISESFKSLI